MHSENYNMNMSCKEVMIIIVLVRVIKQHTSFMYFFVVSS